MSYPSLLAETVSFRGHNGDQGEAYLARPTRPGKFPGVVVIHHMPGWDEWITEVVRKFAHHGFAAVSPHLYFRDGPGNPDDIGARVRDRRPRRRGGLLGWQCRRRRQIPTQRQASSGADRSDRAIARAVARHL